MMGIDQWVLHQLVLVALVFALVGSHSMSNEQMAEYLDDDQPISDDVFDQLQLLDLISCYNGKTKTGEKPNEVCSTGSACYKFVYREMMYDKPSTNETLYEWGCTEVDMCKSILNSLNKCIPNTKLYTADAKITKQGTHCCCSDEMCNAYEPKLKTAGNPTSKSCSPIANPIIVIFLSLLYFLPMR